MFHSDRLTGRRRRKYEQSLKYYPGLVDECFPCNPTQKAAEKLIRDLGHTKAVIQTTCPQTGQPHYLAMIRDKFVLLNHADRQGERALEFFSAKDALRCKCHIFLDYWRTLTDTRDKHRKVGGSILDRAERVSEVPRELLKVRAKCRPPAGVHRPVQFEDSRSRHRSWNCAADTTASGPASRHPGPAKPYENCASKRWQTKRFRDLLATVARRELEVAINTVLAAMDSGVRDRHPLGVAAELQDNYEVEAYTTLSVTCYSPQARGATSGRQTTRPSAVLSACDVLSWYARLYATGRHQCGPWFVVGATAGGFQALKEIDCVLAQAVDLRQVAAACCAGDPRPRIVPVLPGILKRDNWTRRWSFEPLHITADLTALKVLTGHGLDFTTED